MDLMEAGGEDMPYMREPVDLRAMERRAHVLYVDGKPHPAYLAWACSGAGPLQH